MSTTTSFLIQSKYFTPVFNTAIFDGPVRVYFSQHQESDALKMYFRLQEMMNRHKISRETGFLESQNIFVMLYPNEETFLQSFESNDQQKVIEKMGKDYILGIKGPLQDEDFPDLLDMIEGILEQMNKGGNV